MLVVIFGAGASYDSLPAYPPGFNMPDRPPLANELFDNRPMFAQALHRLTCCHPIITYLRSPTTPPSINVEQVLERLMGEADRDPERHRQLAAVRFYLRVALTRCGDQWLTESGGITNYKTLLDQIRHHRSPHERITFVTFNYDTLFEDALRAIGLPLDTMDDYIANDRFKLIKVHGSVDWWRRIRSRPSSIPMHGDVWEVVNSLVAVADRIEVGEPYLRDPALPITGWPSGEVMFPAIAIPLERKRDFECPKAHLDALDDALVRCRKILVVGWRATDAPFRNLLKERLTIGQVEALTVAGNALEAQEVARRLEDSGVKRGAAHCFNGIGFTDFVVTRAAEDFLRT
jgi:hypothetical protein